VGGGTPVLLGRVGKNADTEKILGREKEKDPRMAHSRSSPCTRRRVHPRYNFKKLRKGGSGRKGKKYFSSEKESRDEGGTIC